MRICVSAQAQIGSAFLLVFSLIMLAQPFKVQLTCNPQEYSDVRTELDDI